MHQIDWIWQMRGRHLSHVGMILGPLKARTTHGRTGITWGKMQIPVCSFLLSINSFLLVPASIKHWIIVASQRIGKIKYPENRRTRRIVKGSRKRWETKNHNEPFLFRAKKNSLPYFGACVLVDLIFSISPFFAFPIFFVLHLALCHG